MNPPNHIFSARPDMIHRAEGGVFWLFRLATYFILACGAAVFLSIVINGRGPSSKPKRRSSTPRF